MHFINLLFIPILLVSFFCQLKFAYIVTLLCSAGAACFIYAKESLLNVIITVVLFSLTPLLCKYVKSFISKRKEKLNGEKDQEQTSLEKIIQENNIVHQSNVLLGEEAYHVSELYKLTRDMSAVLDAKEAFSVFSKKVQELFRFKNCRLILVKEEAETLEIERVFEVRYLHSQAQTVDPCESDYHLLRHSLGRHKTIYLEAEDLSKNLNFAKTLESLVLVSLMAETKFLGTLIVEDLPCNELDNFSTLSTQFGLVMKRVKLYEKIQRLAIHDGLTGLFVRRYFMERLDEESKRSQRHNLDLSFLMIDVDHFKDCNDSFGHLAGDVVLKDVARLIKESVREIDLVARYGGEEFSVVLPNTDSGAAAYVAQRIRSSIDAHRVQAYDEVLKIEVSIGVASFPEHSKEPQSLVDKADQALYRAKQEGRNRVCIFE